MFDDDRSNHQHRAKVEINRAQVAPLTKIEHAHYRLAQTYSVGAEAAEPNPGDGS